jgi:signal transduction histidine kinase
MNRSLQFKLLSSFMLVITVLISGVLIGISLFIKEQTLAAKQQQLLDKGKELAVTLGNSYAETGNFANLDALLINADSYLDARIWVLDASRRVVNMSGKGRGPGWRMNGGGGFPDSGHPGMGVHAKGGLGTITNGLDPVFDEAKTWTRTCTHPFYDEKMLTVAVPIILTNGQIGGAVLLNAPVSGIDAFLRHIYFYIGGIGLLAVLIAIWIVNRLSRNIVHPLKAMQQTAAAMARGDYSTLVQVKTDDEVGRLGIALNSLAENLAKFTFELNKMEILRRDFVANVSHELRTPLTIIRGYTEALLDGTVKTSAQVRKYHHSMRDEAVRLERLIKDLLDLSRLQSGRSDPLQDQVPLTAVAGSVVSIMLQQAAQKKITLVFDTSQPVPAINGNGDRLTQLVFILLDNAVKHTPAGGTVTVSVVQKDDTVLLKIVDTGTGIPAEDLPYIWERFYKVDKSHSSADCGTGLGLAIAKQIIDLHRASAEVISEPGHGTAFTIIFPLK